MRQSSIALVLALVLLGRSAQAGCEKDTDCKGARVCENGVCIGEAPPEKAVRAERAPPINRDVGKARSRAIATLVLAPLALIGAGVSAALGVVVNNDDDVWAALAGAQLATLAFAASAYGTGLHGSLIARRSLRGDRGTGLLIAGIATGGVGLLGLLGTTSTAFIFNEKNDAPLVTGWVGGLFGIMAAVGGTLLGVDALLAAGQLRDELEAGETEASVWVSPLFLAGGCGAQVVASF